MSTTTTTRTAAEYFAIATAQDVKAELAGGRRNLNLSLAALTLIVESTDARAEFMALGAECGIAEGTLKPAWAAASAVAEAVGHNVGNGSSAAGALWTRDYLLTLKTDATVLSAETVADVTLDFWAMLPVDAPKASAARAGRVAGSLMRKAHDLLKGANKGAGKGESTDGGTDAESTDAESTDAATVNPDTSAEKVMARLIRDAQLLADLTKAGQMIDVDAWKLLNTALTKAGRASHLLRTAGDKASAR